MSPLPVTPDLSAVARNVVWFEEPPQALADPVRFLAYVMTFATAEEIAVVRRYVSDQDWRAALAAAPPGIFDERSWTYWNLMAGRDPAPPMPTRVLP